MLLWRFLCLVCFREKDTGKPGTEIYLKSEFRSAGRIRNFYLENMQKCKASVSSHHTTGFFTGKKLKKKNVQVFETAKMFYFPFFILSRKS